MDSVEHDKVIMDNPENETDSIEFGIVDGVDVWNVAVLQFIMEEDIQMTSLNGSRPKLHGKNSTEAWEINKWLQYAFVFSSGSLVENACGQVDNHLTLRTFLVGYKLSIADVAVCSALAGIGPRWESLQKSKKYENLVRWYNSICEEYSVALNEITSKYIGKRGLGKSVLLTKPKAFGGVKPNSVSISKTYTLDMDLPGVEDVEVWLRFAPEPSGYLHIGHSKAALLNRYFADKYDGKLIIRFDDTNPSKETNEFVQNVLKDVKTLGIKYDKVSYTSDYFQELMDMAEKLIWKGKAYVDDTRREQMQNERMDGIESKCRNNSVEENIRLWKEMISGSDRGKQCCLRGKLDMQDPNKSLRDPVYYRFNPDPHHRIGVKYKVYPTYDFACPFVDSYEKVTHALRSSEYHDRNAQYHRILEDMRIVDKELKKVEIEDKRIVDKELKKVEIEDKRIVDEELKKVEIYEFSRLNMVYTLLSKRKLLWFVQNGKVDGWNDPRFPTVQGMVRRGLQIEALKQFIYEQGASRKLNLMEWDKLWTINKKKIDPICPRHTAIIEDRKVIFQLTNGPSEPFVCILPRHKKYEGAGTKCTTFKSRILLEYVDACAVSEGEEITLMDWGNAIVKEIKKENGVVKELFGVLNLEGSIKTTKLKLTWLPEMDELVKLSLINFDYLIKKKKLEDGEQFLDNLNPCTRKETVALGDPNMKNLKEGDILQLERKTYYRCDVPYLGPSKPIVLFAIPDGKKQASLN